MGLRWGVGWMEAVFNLVLFRVIGIAVLALIGLAVLVVLIRRSQAARAAAAAPPPRIHLRPCARPDWSDPKGIERDIVAILTLGFADAGCFEVPEIPRLSIQAYAKQSEGMLAALCDHPAAGKWLDLVTLYEDGTSVTYTTNPHGDPLDQRPGHPKVRAPEVDVRTLYHRLLNQRPPGAFRRIPPAEFVPVFEKAYADEMDWRLATGRPTGREATQAAAAARR
jgi:hypothetical protein